MLSALKIILVGAAMLAAGWFAGSSLTSPKETPPPPASGATTTGEVSVKEVIKEVVKEVPVIKEKIVIQDISQTKINGYENQIATLKTQLDQTYREIGNNGETDGYIVRIYPHGGDQPTYLDRIAVYEMNGSKTSGLNIKMIKQEYDAGSGYSTVASTTYSIDSDNFVKNLDVTLEKTPSGIAKYSYKFYAIVEGVSKFLFSFPTK